MMRPDTDVATAALPGTPDTTRTCSVAVCALTYRRPAGLARLLEALAGLETPDGTAVEVVIVDNDAERSGEPVVAAARAGMGLPVRYVVEPSRSISVARNRAISEAGPVEFVAFVDDDEWPRPDWLVELLQAQQATGADVVAAGVMPVFDSEPPAWVLAGRFFERRRHVHHEQINYATTSNVLIRRGCLDLVPGPFDAAFGLSGGEDTHLFAQLVRAGCRIVWCDTAAVQESIPDSRVSAGWLLRREYRRGQTLSLSLRASGGSPWRVLRRVGNGLRHVGAGVVATVSGTRRGRAGVLRGVRRTAFGIGMLAGLAGLRHEEYRTVHGG
jgi:glycosyltransferase involved in cell wall biosynthesis